MTYQYDGGGSFTLLYPHASSYVVQYALASINADVRFQNACACNFQYFWAPHFDSLWPTSFTIRLGS